MSKFFKLFLCLNLLLVFMLGPSCEKKSFYSLTEVEWILVMINDYPNIFHDNLFDTQPDSTSGGPGFPSFYRQITYREPRDTIAISDTLVPGMLVASVWEKDSIAGKFHVFEDGDWYETTFVAGFKMRAYLEKWGKTSDPYNGWLIKGLSPVITYSIGSFNPYFNLSVVSTNGNNCNYASTDSSILDLDSISLVLSVGDTVYLHLTSIDKTNHIYLHYYHGNTFRKVRFTDNGALDAQFVVTDASYRYRHFFVDIVDKNSVGPPPGNYRAKTWGVLYKIH